MPPRRRPHRLPDDRQALPGRPVHGLPLDLRIAVLEERLGESLRPDGERAALGIDVEERGGLLAAERGEALPDLGQVAGHEQQMAHGVDAGGGLRGDDAAVAVGDHDGRLVARRQYPPDRVDVLGQPGASRARSAIAGSEGALYLRIFSRLHDTAGEPLWPGFRRTATTDWLAPLETGMRSLGRPELATVVLAVIRGLLMDLDATGDAPRTRRAFHDFLGTIDGG